MTKKTKKSDDWHLGRPFDERFVPSPKLNGRGLASKASTVDPNYDKIRDAGPEEDYECVDKHTGKRNGIFSVKQIEQMATLFKRKGELQYPKDFPTPISKATPDRIVRSARRNLALSTGKRINIVWTEVPEVAILRIGKQ